MPRWRESQGAGWEEDDAIAMVMSFLEWLVLGLLVPLVLVVLETPVAVVRGLFGRTGWVEAVCRWPAEVRITWRTTRSERRALADEIAARLERGYERLTPDRAELVEMTKPPGTDDLDV
jgi:hypothetical protein